MLCVLIMAGGIGRRFWPQSTERKPKQFLKLLGNRTMIQMTYDRMRKLVSDECIFVVTNDRYINLVKEQLPNIRDINIIHEPYSKNTGPCILLSSLYIRKIYPDANVICVASDSYIGKEDEFLKNVKIASDFVNENKKAIVTIGITPTRPDTEYGYIKYQKGDIIPNKVVGFVEKPNYELAKKYLDSKEYLWNASIYVYNNLNMLEEIKNNLPNEYNLLKDLPNINDNKYSEYLMQNYNKCQEISVGCAVMEKSLNIYTVPSNIDWDDVGSWESLKRYTKKDSNGNIIRGDAKIIDSHNSIIYGNGKKIVLVNANDLFCIDSDDTIIVGRREDFGQVHLLKDEIEKDAN